MGLGEVQRVSGGPRVRGTLRIAMPCGPGFSHAACAVLLIAATARFGAALDLVPRTRPRMLPPAHHLRLRGGSEPAPTSGPTPSEPQIRSTLTALGGVHVPSSLVDAVRDGRAGLELVERFGQWHGRLPRSMRWVLYLKPFRERILADNGFILKWAIEATLACAVQFVAEIQHRREDFVEECDFALGGVCAVLFSSTAYTLFAAPVAIPAKKRRRETWWDAWLRSCPHNMFESGPPRFSFLQRITAYFRYMPRLFATGFLSSFVGYIYITALLLVRHAWSKLNRGGKWRRKPKTLSSVVAALSETEAQGPGGGVDERRQLLSTVGLGSLSNVALASIGIDPGYLDGGATAASGQASDAAMHVPGFAPASPSPYHAAVPAAAAAGHDNTTQADAASAGNTDVVSAYAAAGGASSDPATEAAPPCSLTRTRPGAEAGQVSVAGTACHGEGAASRDAAALGHVRRNPAKTVAEGGSRLMRRSSQSHVKSAALELDRPVCVVVLSLCGCVCVRARADADACACANACARYCRGVCLHMSVCKFFVYAYALQARVRSNSFGDVVHLLQHASTHTRNETLTAGSNHTHTHAHTDTDTETHPDDTHDATPAARCPAIRAHVRPDPGAHPPTPSRDAGEAACALVPGHDSNECSMDGTGKANWASQNDGNVGGVAVDGGIKARKQGGEVGKGGRQQGGDSLVSISGSLPSSRVIDDQGSGSVRTGEAASGALSRTLSPFSTPRLKMPRVFEQAAASVTSVVRGRGAARRSLFAAAAVASPVRSLARSSTMLADIISTGRRPILRRLPGVPMVVFQGGRSRQGLSLMIESPTLARPSPSLVFLPPKRGEGEGIGLIPWAEVLKVSLVCGVYVAVWSNIRSHMVAGIEIRLLHRHLPPKWRPIGSLLLRTSNLYVGSILLLLVLSHLDSAAEEQADVHRLSLGSQSTTQRQDSLTNSQEADVTADATRMRSHSLLTGH